MKKKRIIITSAILIVVIAYIKGCAYLPIEGTVVDTETGKPIEGAVVLAEWTIGSWIPDGPTRVYKVIETVSDKSGKFTINAFILRPTSDSYLTIYKAGYVCWNNRFIFPGYKHRKDFKWGSHRKYELERFKKEYSYADHGKFIRHFIISATKIFENAYRWEETMELKELRGEK